LSVRKVTEKNGQTFVTLKSVDPKNHLGRQKLRAWTTRVGLHHISQCSPGHFPHKHKWTHTYRLDFFKRLFSLNFHLMHLFLTRHQHRHWVI